MKTRLMIALILLISLQVTGQPADLAKNFKSPPPEYSLLPFWSLNGTLKPEKMTWQVDQMMGKGVYGAFLHARAGLDESETPYFSDGFWKAIDSTIRYSASKGFYTYLYDEDKWPSGSAGGRTIAANPEEFVKKVLFYQKMEVVGPQTINLHLQKNPLAVFAGRFSASGNYDSGTQVNLTGSKDSPWNVPERRWAIISFEMRKDPGAQIDYLDSAAVAQFIKITHEEYYKRYGKYFGNTIPGIFFDEIYANYSKMTENIFWTDDFLEQFRKIKGYDLTEKLPLILLNDPGKSEKLRYDYFDVVQDLFTKAWFKQYADWCTAHGIWATGHTTEKLLHYKRQSDYFTTMGQLQVPGTDNEEYRYGFPRLIDWYNPKQISSIAHLYDRKRVMAESMGGGGYTILPEEYRYGFSMLGVYGINLFIPHLFHYTVDTPESQADWPPSWFFTNPYWKYFRPLADFARRISFMNSQGRAVSDVAILFPLTDLWEGGYPDRIDDSFYKQVQQLLIDNHIDFDIIDPKSLAGCSVEGKELYAGNGKYKVLVLPAIHAIRTDALNKIADFIEKGGSVIALKELPSISENSPAGDEQVSLTMEKLFGFPPSALRPDEYYQWNPDQTERFTTRKNNNGGTAFFTRFPGQLPVIINKTVTTDFEVKGTNGGSLRFNHREIDSTEVYLLVNDRNENENYHVSLKNKGIPSIWNPETGDVVPFENYCLNGNRMEMVLSFKPRESYFLVLEPKNPDPASGLITGTNLSDYRVTHSGNKIKVEGWGKTDQVHLIQTTFKDKRVEKSWASNRELPSIALDGNWQFQLAPRSLDDTWNSTIANDTIALPVMKFQPERTPDEGSENHWKETNFKDDNWKTVKIADVFNMKQGIQRYLSGWDASWISYYDYSVHLPEIAGGDRTFKKIFRLDGAVREAKIAIAADQSYRLFVNGRLAASGDDPNRASICDVAGFLRKGENIIEVKTSSTKGLLLQGTIRQKNKEPIRIRTDESWLVSAGEAEWQPAFRLADPPLGSWGNILNPIKKIAFPLTVWYRQQLPAGAISLVKPEIRGKYTLYVNGTPVKFENEKELADISALVKKNVNILSICVFATDEQCGIIQPVSVVCSKTETPLVPWNNMGLGWYSGRAIYTKKVTIPSGYLENGTRLMLDPGRVNYFAEVWVNDRLVTFHPWAPFETDITGYLKNGENTIALVVANLSANQATWNILDANISSKEARWWHDGSLMREKDKLESGLLGPVKIVPFCKESVEIE